MRRWWLVTYVGLWLFACLGLPGRVAGLWFLSGHTPMWVALVPLVVFTVLAIVRNAVWTDLACATVAVTAVGRAAFVAVSDLDEGWLLYGRLLTMYVWMLLGLATIIIGGSGDARGPRCR